MMGRYNSGRFTAVVFIGTMLVSSPRPALMQAETEPVYVLETIAGDIGDGEPARRAKLVCPVSLAVDHRGDLYFADRGDSRVRKIDPNGTITTVAGNGIFFTDGDGGPAVLASLNDPTAVAFDRAGNLLIGEGIAGRRIRRVDAGTGIISTIAGTGDIGHGGDGDGGPALAAAFRDIKDIAVADDGTVLVVDDQQVRQITPDGTIQTIAGSPFDDQYNGDEIPARQATLSPESVAVDGRGNIYVADFGNHRIRKITPDGIIHTVAGNGVPGFAGDGGKATQARLAYPGGVAVDADGRLYISDYGNRRVRKVDPSGTITTVAGDGTYGFRESEDARRTGFYWLVDVAVDQGGNVYAADIEFFSTFEASCDRVYTNTGIRKITPEGRAIWLAGSGFVLGDGQLALYANLIDPWGLAVDQAGNIYIADTGHARVRRIERQSGVINTLAGGGDPDLRRRRSDPDPIQEGALATEAELNYPVDVAVDRKGNVYIVDEYWSQILKVTPEGRIFTFVGRDCRDSRVLGDGGPAEAGCLFNPQGVTVGPDGSLYIADTGHQRIRKVNMETGHITTVAGNGTFADTGDGGRATEAGLLSPIAVAVAEDGTLYLVTYQNLRKVSPDGTISTIATGLGSLRGDIVVDTSGNVYVTQLFRPQVGRIDSGRVFTPVVGNGRFGFTPGGWLATQAALNRPIGLALLPNGDLIITDAGNQSVHCLRQTDEIPDGGR
jgi:sugar lactone lactonase YvrE